MPRQQGRVVSEHLQVVLAGLDAPRRPAGESRGARGLLAGVVGVVDKLVANLDALLAESVHPQLPHDHHREIDGRRLVPSSGHQAIFQLERVPLLPSQAGEHVRDGFIARSVHTAESDESEVVEAEVVGAFRELHDDSLQRLVRGGVTSHVRLHVPVDGFPRSNLRRHAQHERHLSGRLRLRRHPFSPDQYPFSHLRRRLLSTNPTATPVTKVRVAIFAV
mmetsp:Transcript_14250/g.56230  ORF Transcript_14250/g.56230 Transcript_14250/m.56230 type:complete len:220 (-) Transcript_14250:43-702(-)